MTEVLGQRVPRSNAVLQVTGKAVYAVDLARPGMLFAKALHSPWPHARILSLDVSPALAHPGVAAVITGADIPNNRIGFTHVEQPILADDVVRYRGDAIAVVAAESEAVAREATRLIQVEYEPLPAVFDPLEAMQPEAPRIHEKGNVASHVKIRDGDVEKGFAEADEIVEETYSTQMVEHAHIEPHVALAEVDALGAITLHSSVGRPFLTASDVGRILEIPMNRIRLIVPAVGGSFGGKNETTLEPWVCLLALKTGRPVKMTFTREEEFEASTVRHPYIIKYKSGVRQDGTLVARQVEIISDTGAYVSWGESTLSKGCIHAAGPYRIPHVKIDGYLVYTNQNVGGAMRGFGATQSGYAVECHTDTLATRLGMDPVEFRLKNLLVDGSALPTGQVLEQVTAKATLREAVRLAGWNKEVKWE
jgi:CO/xanthine dehydrogenase Mo-binding subunit